MKPANDPSHEELLTRWIDGQLGPEELAAVEREAAGRPELLAEKKAAHRIGDLMRAHLPVSVEPESPEFFTSRIMDEVYRTAAAPAPRRRAWSWKWLTSPWFASLASASAVAAVFLSLNAVNPGVDPGSLARPYSPDPNVTARAYYSREADALVIDLQGLEAVPDEREIRAFDIAESGPASRDVEEEVLVAAGEGRLPVLVLHRGPAGSPPVFRELR